MNRTNSVYLLSFYNWFLLCKVEHVNQFLLIKLGLWNGLIWINYWISFSLKERSVDRFRLFQSWLCGTVCMTYFVISFITNHFYGISCLNKLSLILVIPVLIEWKISRGFFRWIHRTWLNTCDMSNMNHRTHGYVGLISVQPSQINNRPR